MSTHVPGFRTFFRFWYQLAKLAPSSIRVKCFSTMREPALVTVAVCGLMCGSGRGRGEERIPGRIRSCCMVTELQHHSKIRAVL